MSQQIDVKFDEITRLEEALKKYGEGCEDIVNEVIHEQAGPIIRDEIKRLMPVSGVKAWKGKKPHAKFSNSLLIDNKENLSVTIRTKADYHYLYFPDDGTTTVRHAGEQHFFKRGAENKEDMIVDLCIAKLIDEFEEIE